MVVMVLEKVPAGVRGQLSRWMIEPSRSVFVGKLSGMVRDKLWQKCTEKAHGSGVVQIYSMDNEQGFAIRLAGDTSRLLADFDGLKLVKVPK